MSVMSSQNKELCSRLKPVLEMRFLDVVRNMATPMAVTYTEARQTVSERRVICVFGIERLLGSSLAMARGGPSTDS